MFRPPTARATCAVCSPPPTRPSRLAWADFDPLAERDLAERLLRAGGGASILLHGPPGTGKTEFARALATRCGARAVFAGEADDSGGEPDRSERLAHLLLLRALLRNDRRRLIVMDEAEDVLVLGERERGRRSKLWLNRLVETNDGPTIWIANDHRSFGEAVLRRMDLAIGFARPGRARRARIIARQARRHGAKLGRGGAARLAELPAAPAVLDAAVRGAARMDGGADEAMALGRSLVTAIAGAPPAIPALPADYDPALARADACLATLAERLAAAGPAGWSLLASGPSGTGKSAFARHLAERMGVDLVERSGSDLLGPFVGQTEANIAAAFEEARGSGAMLLIDEADDFLCDRRSATRSWERSLVNETLRRLERIETPVHRHDEPCRPARSRRAAPLHRPRRVPRDDARPGGGVVPPALRRCLPERTRRPDARRFCGRRPPRRIAPRNEPPDAGELACRRGRGAGGGARPDRLLTRLSLTPRGRLRGRNDAATRSIAGRRRQTGPMSLFAALQRLVPHHALTKLAGRLAASEHPRVARALIRRFARAYGIDWSEAERPEREYRSFNDFFTRTLKPGARPLADASRFVLSPADGAVSQLGRIARGRIVQAKGRDYTARELLGGEASGDGRLAERFEGGAFATIYLSPRDYHRVHMPAAGRLVETVYAPGKLFSVNTATAGSVDRLFARNERLVCLFDTELGRMASVMVGAMIVAGIETRWGGRVAGPRPRAGALGSG